MLRKDQNKGVLKMTIAVLPTPSIGDGETRKPRIALMGEFSAGKSTLSNLLIGSTPLPVKVTATQLPPVWIAYGEKDPYLEDMDGNIHPIDLNELEMIEPDETRVIRIFQKSDMLELCDLIDMPGISDPNMSPERWEPILNQADGVIWCTHATQAWRQSEAATWASMKPELYSKSLLLLTRFDKLLNDVDRQRVLKRVNKETKNMFAGCFPISLAEAVAAKDDREKWENSGAEAFSERLVEILNQLSNNLGGGSDRSSDFALKDTLIKKPSPSHDEDKEATEGAVQPGWVVPRRVKIANSNISERPGRPSRVDGVPPISGDAIRETVDVENRKSQPL